MPKIELTRGQTARVDKEDFDFLSKWSWFARPRGYAGRSMKNPSRTIHMHRVILERKIGRKLEDDEVVDHINGITNDNRRINLQVANQSINNIKKSRQKNNTSGYRGVSYYKASDKWQGYISKDGKRIHLGHFSTPEDAHSAYLGARECLYHGVIVRS